MHGKKLRAFLRFFFMGSLCTALPSYSNEGHHTVPLQSSGENIDQNTLGKLLQGTENTRGTCMAGGSVKQSYNGSTKTRKVGRMPMGYFLGMMATFARSACELQEADSGTYRNYSESKKEVLKREGTNPKRDALLLPKSQGAFAQAQSNLVKNYALLLPLGMMESSGNTYDGRDKSASNYSSKTVEAGLFQVSYNSVNNKQVSRKIYKELLQKYENGKSPLCMLDLFRQGHEKKKKTKDWGSGDGKEFQRIMKECPALATEYMSVLARRDYRHNGPLKREEARARPECVQVLNQVEKNAMNMCQQLGNFNIDPNNLERFRAKGNKFDYNSTIPDEDLPRWLAQAQREQKRKAKKGRDTSELNDLLKNEEIRRKAQEQIQQNYQDQASKLNSNNAAAQEELNNLNRQRDAALEQIETPPAPSVEAPQAEASVETEPLTATEKTAPASQQRKNPATQGVSNNANPVGANEGKIGASNAQNAQSPLSTRAGSELSGLASPSNPENSSQTIQQNPKSSLNPQLSKQAQSAPPKASEKLKAKPNKKIKTKKKAPPPTSKAQTENPLQNISSSQPKNPLQFRRSLSGAPPEKNPQENPPEPTAEEILNSGGGIEDGAPPVIDETLLKERSEEEVAPSEELGPVYQDGKLPSDYFEAPREDDYTNFINAEEKSTTSTQESISPSSSTNLQDSTALPLEDFSSTEPETDAGTTEEDEGLSEERRS